MQKIKSTISVLVVVMTAAIFLNGQTVVGQSTLASVTTSKSVTEKSTGSFKKEDNNGAATDDAERQELRRRVQELEERLGKLEKLLQASGTAIPYANVRNSNPEPPASPRDTIAQENSAKPASMDMPDKEQDKGFLGFFRKAEVSGFVDGYYGYNFNNPFNRRNQLRNFDFKSNEFGLNLAELVIEKKPDQDSRGGFRLDLDYGPATDWVHSAEPGGVEVYKIVQQAYGSYLAPVGSGLQIDVGKFVTWNGAEVIETKDNWNYSRGLLFAWAIPYYHTGLRATYAFNGKVSLTGALVNGWNNVEENNGGKTLGLSLSLKPTSKLAIVQNYTVGPEEIGSVPAPTALADKRFIRHLSDTVLNYTVNSKLALLLNYDYAIERQRVTGDKVHWQGLAAYLRYSPTEKFAFSPRFEWFDDYNGFATCSEDPLGRCDKGKTFKEFTLTGEYKFAKNIIGRLEFRNDWADTPFFRKGAVLPDVNPASVLSKNQPTITAGLIFTFSTREQ